MKAAIAADPKNVMARANLAELYLRQNDTAKAEATLRQAAEDLYDSSGAGLLATYYIRTKQLDPGAAAYADLVAKHPKSTPLKVAYVRLLILNKDLAKARTIADELAKTDPGDPEVAVLNGMLLLNDGKINEAFTDLQKAAKNNPDSLVVKIWLGRAARVKGDMTVAQQSFRDAVKLNPRSLEAQEGLAQIAIERAISASSHRSPTPPSPSIRSSRIAYIWRGMAEGNQKDYDKADADFHQAIKLDPKNSAGYLELAQLRLIQKKIPEAKTLLEQALDNNPNSARALRLLRRPLYLKSSPPRPSAACRSRSPSRRKTAEMYDLLAELQMSTGDAKAALSLGREGDAAQSGRWCRGHGLHPRGGQSRRSRQGHRHLAAVD